jgi:hypothetical protein
MVPVSLVPTFTALVTTLSTFFPALMSTLVAAFSALTDTRPCERCCWEQDGNRKCGQSKFA